jgi:hypothetical protein
VVVGTTNANAGEIVTPTTEGFTIVNTALE